MAWRLAHSLSKLREQISNEYPLRSKASDGTIGDAAHSKRASDHNPNNAGVVCGMDLTNDPAHGFDAHAIADVLRTMRHPDLKYIISNGRIAGAWSQWEWQGYNGSNPHTKHIHISVGHGNDGQSTAPYDDTNAWTIKRPTASPTKTNEPRELYLKPTVSAYSYYRPGTPLPVKRANRESTLNPKKWGGLRYGIIRKVAANTYEVKSPSLGIIWIWAGDSDSQLIY